MPCRPDFDGQLIGPPDSVSGLQADFEIRATNQRMCAGAVGTSAESRPLTGRTGNLQCKRHEDEVQPM